MKRDCAILLFLLSALVPFFAMSEEARPPSSATIYDTLERLWSGRKFVKVDAYVKGLEKSWSHYVPVQLTLAIYSDHYGGQVEDTVARLKTLREKLTAEAMAVSPVFLEFLDSGILMYGKTQEFYRRRGISRDDRLAQMNPLGKSTFKHAKHWGDEMMYFNVPEVFLTEQGIVPARSDKSMTDDAGLKQKNVQQLLQGIGNDKAAMDARKAAVRELIERRAAEGGPKEVARGLCEANMVYTYHDTVEELAKTGRDAVPSVLEILNDPSGSNTDKKCAIWALVRIGVVDPDVIQPLQAISSNTDRADLAKYAQNALQYLQAKDHD